MVRIVLVPPRMRQSCCMSAARPFEHEPKPDGGEGTISDQLTDWHDLPTCALETSDPPTTPVVSCGGKGSRQNEEACAWIQL